MPKWLTKILRQIQNFAKERRVRLTHKALRELETINLGLDYEDVRLLLENLSEDDFEERLASESTKEWLYVFKPVVARTTIYLKIAIRNSCIVISFHEDDTNEE